MSLFNRLINGLRQRLPPGWGGFPLSADAQEFIAYNRRKWPALTAAEPPRVVMVSLFDWKPTICTYSIVTNHLARKQNATIEGFLLQRFTDRRLEAVFSSFGAALGLSLKTAKPFESQVRTLADTIFRGLKSKWDVVGIQVDGVPLGDLIYDSYLRELSRSTVVLDDPRLHEYLLHGLRVYFACKSYLERKKPLAVIPDHIVYIEGGILARVAARAGIPIYMVDYSPKLKMNRLVTQALDGSFTYPTRWPYWKYPQLFQQLPAPEQELALTRARAALQSRLAGQIDHSVLRGTSAYTDFDAENRVLADNGRPRILILLHDFTDAVHIYRSLLFPDFLEWIHFLLSEASETPFDWYVKPHPNISDPSRAALNANNIATVAKLREKYPKIHFLEPGTSNHQVIREGIDAMFTVYGTAGHEFAYLGIPVVNAGDNPHIAYDFNIHARSTEQYRELIHQADRLEVTIDPQQIEEYYFMNYIYRNEALAAAVAPFDPAAARSDQTDFYQRFLKENSPEREQQIEAYFDEVLARQSGVEAALSA